jgi:hypothetical protein
MYKEVLRSITGIEIYPVVSLVVFTVFFALVIAWTARLDRRHLERLAQLPLDGKDV